MAITYGLKILKTLLSMFPNISKVLSLYFHFLTLPGAPTGFGDFETKGRKCLWQFQLWLTFQWNDFRRSEWSHLFCHTFWILRPACNWKLSYVYFIFFHIQVGLKTVKNSFIFQLSLLIDFFDFFVGEDKKLLSC